MHQDMQKPTIPLLTGLCGALLAILLLQFIIRPVFDKAIPETAYQRVLRTGTLRCGYQEQPGILEKDSEGNLAGIAADYAQAVTKQSRLKLEWVAADNTSQTNLIDGKYDALCGHFDAISKVKDNLVYTMPIYYLPVYAYTRSTNKKFDRHYDWINLPSVKIAVAEYTVYAELARISFPQATLITRPAALDQVANGTVDITFVDALTGQTYLKNYPNKLRQVHGPVLRLLSAGLTLPPDELLLKNMLDNATRELQLSGVIDRILDKYEIAQNLYRPSLRYTDPALRNERGIYTPPDEDGPTDDVTGDPNSAN